MNDLPFSYIYLKSTAQIERLKILGIKVLRLKKGGGAFCYTSDQPFGISVSKSGAKSHVALICGIAIELSTGVDDNQRISERLCMLSEIGAQEDFFDLIDDLSGRHVIIATHPVSKNLIILSDASGMKKVVCSEKDLVCSSNFNLINDARGVPLSRRVLATGEFYKHWKYGVLGDFQPLEETRILTPNHYLDLDSGKVVRFFPRRPLEVMDVVSVISIIENCFSTQLEKLSKKYKLGFTLTAGLDSRVSLAVSRHYVSGSSFMTYCTTDDNLVDLRISQEIANKMQLKHYSVIRNKYADEVDEQISSPVILPKEIPADLAQRFKAFTRMNHGQRIVSGYREISNIESNARPFLHIRSNIFEVGTVFWRRWGRAITAAEILKKSRPDWHFNKEIREVFTEYFDHTSLSAESCFNYDLLDMFYWEHRMGTWHSEVLQETDFAFNTHTLINSRRVISSLLSVPYDERLSSSVYNSLIKKHLPEIDDLPINPSEYPKFNRAQS